MVYIIPLCYVILSKVVLCLLPSYFMLLSSAPSRPTMLPLQSSGGTIRKELALGGKYCIIYNPLILPSTGYTGDLGDAQLQSRGPGGQPSLTCLGIWSSKCCHSSNCSGICQSQGSQVVVMPRHAQEPNSREAITPRPAWGSAPLPWDAWLSGCNSTG